MNTKEAKKVIQGNTRPILLHPGHHIAMSLVEKGRKLVNFGWAMLPGRTLPKKLIYTLGPLSVFGWATKSGYYIVNEETIYMISFILTVRLLYVLLADPVNAYFQAQDEVLTIFV